MNPEPETTEDRYLGDGVYASYDGYHIWLDLRGQSGARIALEPDVFIGLQVFASDIREAEKHGGPPEELEAAPT